MPTYSYECPTCAAHLERWFKSYRERTDEVDCPECGGYAKFVIDAPAITWRHTPKDPFRRVPDNPVKTTVPSNYNITPNRTEIVPAPESMKKKFRLNGKRNNRKRSDKHKSAVKEY